MLHSKRVKHRLLEVNVPRHSGHDLDDGRRYVYAGIRIVHSSSRFKQQRAGGSYRGNLPEFGATRPTASADFGAFCADFKWKTAGMVKYHPDSQGIASKPENGGAVGAGLYDIEFFKFRQILRYRVIELYPALFYELCHSHAAESLGLGTLHIYVSQLYRTLFLHVRIAYAAGFLNSVLI